MTDRFVKDGLNDSRQAFYGMLLAKARCCLLHF